MHVLRIFSVFVFLIVTSLAQAERAYYVVDLHNLGYGYSWAHNVNDQGVVTGRIYLEEQRDLSHLSGNTHIFIADANSGMVDMGNLGGLFGAGYAINNSGVIAGFGHPSPTSGYTGVVGTLEQGLEQVPVVPVHDINDNNILVGQRHSSNGQLRGVVGNAEIGFTEISPLGGYYSRAFAINDNGVVTGHSDTDLRRGRAYVWDAVNGTRAIGTLGGSTSIGRDINNNNQVVGASRIASNKAQHAFIWEEGKGMLDLGSLGDRTIYPAWSTAYGINDNGEVVGSTQAKYPTNRRHAFIWAKGEGMRDLNDLVVDMTGWQYLRTAEAISNTGYITGMGVTASNDISAFLLIPVSAANTLPVADAGTDQTVHVGDVVTLVGSAQDDDNDTLSYTWSLTRPDNSDGTLDLSSTMILNPAFVPTMLGDYTATLIANDGTADSLASSVTITVTNTEPVAQFGVSSSPYYQYGNITLLSSSYDADGDPITHFWSLDSVPQGSLTTLSQSDGDTTAFIPDIPGNYTVSLIVNDGYVDSVPSVVMVEVLSTEAAAEQTTVQLQEYINAQLKSSFTKNKQKTLTNKLNNDVMPLIEAGNFVEARQILVEDIFPKADGCIFRGEPDSPPSGGFAVDWVTDCQAQQDIYDLIKLLDEILSA